MTGTTAATAAQTASRTDTSTGTAAASASASAEPPLPVDDDEPGGPAGEPERRTLTAVADEAAVDANRDFIADHWGVVQLPFPLQLQTMRLPRSRRALLLTGQGPALDKPLVLVVGPENTIAWSKARPLAGTHEQARELTITRGPHGQVLLFLYDEPSKQFAARTWTSEGGIFADFQVLTAEACDAATVLYWPGQGWIAALVSGGTLHAHFLGETGTLRWPGNGIEVPLSTAPRAPSPKAAASAVRPKIAIVDGKTIEIAVGTRKVRVSQEGAVLK